MDHAEKIAQKIAPKLQAELEKKGFIIPTIVAVSALVSLIINLIKLAKLCKYDADEALNHIKKPNVIDKIKIRKAIRSSLRENKVSLPRGKESDESLILIEKAISDAASKLTKKDINFISEGIGD